MLTRCPHCGGWAWATRGIASFYGGAKLLWRRTACWRGHRALETVWG